MRLRSWLILAALVLTPLIFSRASPRPALGWKELASAGEAVAPAQGEVQSLAAELNRLFGTRVQACPGQVENAAAISGDRVLYNPGFLQSIGHPHSVFGVLAHEWAHHFRHHVDEVGSTWDKELEADYYSGAALRLTGRHKDHYEAFLGALAGGGSHTHPAGSRRVLSIEKGWKEAAGGPLAVGLPAPARTPPGPPALPLGSWPPDRSPAP